jgi:hypothetical protein
MKRTARDTALLLAVILKRSDQTRARISAKTLKVLGRRQNLRSAFVVDIIAALADHDWVLFELASGGYGAMQAKALEAAKAVTAAKFLDADERAALRENDELIPSLEEELESDQDDANDDE